VRSPRHLTAAALLAAALPMVSPMVPGAVAVADAADGPVLTREVVGTSVLGRPITVVHRAHEGATQRVLVIGHIHGDERAGLRVVRRLLDRADLPPDLDLYLARTVNPDGTAAVSRTNAHGVDLNRNFPYKWATSPRGSTWSGPSALSEPESVALRDLIRRIDPWLVVTFHQPLFGVGANDKGTPTVRAIARGMQLPVDDFACTGVCHGSFTSWVNHRTGSLAVTVEFGETAPAWRIARAARTVVSVGAAGPPA
jgi:predicted deacylase